MPTTSVSVACTFMCLALIVVLGLSTVSAYEYCVTYPSNELLLKPYERVVLPDGRTKHIMRGELSVGDEHDDETSSFSHDYNYLYYPYWQADTSLTSSMYAGCNFEGYVHLDAGDYIEMWCFGVIPQSVVSTTVYANDMDADIYVFEATPTTDTELCTGHPTSQLCVSDAVCHQGALGNKPFSSGFVYPGRPDGQPTALVFVFYNNNLLDSDTCTVSFSVTCPCQNGGYCTGFDGTECSCLGHYSPSSQCTECAVGWSGADCDQPLCSPACVNGECTGFYYSYPSVCECDSGWSGTTCDTPICADGCGAYGTCVAPDQCSCEQGWSGATCDTPVCDPCSSHGTCVSPYVCQCDSGWSGSGCETPMPLLLDLLSEVQSIMISNINGNSSSAGEYAAQACKLADVPTVLNDYALLDLAMIGCQQANNIAHGLDWFGHAQNYIVPQDFSVYETAVNDLLAVLQTINGNISLYQEEATTFEEQLDILEVQLGEVLTTLEQWNHVVSVDQDNVNTQTKQIAAMQQQMVTAYESVADSISQIEAKVQSDIEQLQEAIEGTEKDEFFSVLEDVVNLVADLSQAKGVAGDVTIINDLEGIFSAVETAKQKIEMDEKEEQQLKGLNQTAANSLQFVDSLESLDEVFSGNISLPSLLPYIDAEELKSSTLDEKFGTLISVARNMSLDTSSFETFLGLQQVFLEYVGSWYTLAMKLQNDQAQQSMTSAQGAYLTNVIANATYDQETVVDAGLTFLEQQYQTFVVQNVMVLAQEVAQFEYFSLSTYSCLSLPPNPSIKDLQDVQLQLSEDVASAETYRDDRVCCWTNFTVTNTSNPTFFDLLQLSSVVNTPILTVDTPIVQGNTSLCDTCLPYAVDVLDVRAYISPEVSHAGSNSTTLDVFVTRIGTSVFLDENNDVWNYTCPPFTFEFEYNIDTGRPVLGRYHRTDDAYINYALYSTWSVEIPKGVVDLSVIDRLTLQFKVKFMQQESSYEQLLLSGGADPTDGQCVAECSSNSRGRRNMRVL